MITEKDLQEAIAACEGERRPTASTCIKLAAFYALKDRKHPAEPVNYSYMDAGPEVISYDSGSEFSKKIDGRRVSDILPIIDDLMDALIAINPRLYNSVMRKL